ncbi:embryonal Fyn-associated substrate isoform X1 [Mauremys mutica]|uniref:embryonal Fyn-associated substrate isoform X1 n=1 Tax=Mauremys mutica TaxID=74926 RepID=UPI001D165F0D|nr:embryonal Fyn-associated substrate isoform X1 [Mauremys mutica]
MSPVLGDTGLPPSSTGSTGPSVPRPSQHWGSPASLPAGPGGPRPLSQPALGIHCSLCPQAQLARALFDNVAECPEELSFRRGDLMLVLQPKVPGLAGWHLCSLHGQQGIVPANRVCVLPEPGPPDLSPAPRKESAPPVLYKPPQGQRSSSAGQKEEQQEVYVVPPPTRPCLTPCDDIYKVPRATRRDSDPSEVYDVPCSLLRDAPLSDTYDTPSPFPKQAAELDADPYNVPPPAKPPPVQEEEEEEGRGEEAAPVYAAPSNLRRASALLNLYESPEELLGGEYDLPGPPTPEAALGGLSLGEVGGVGRRPRLPSAESLSRRPLPALPSPSPRKGSIQDRPLPPPPPRLGGLAGGPDEGAGDGHSEYEGIRLAEEYDYVHLKGTDRLQPPATDCDPPEEATSPRPQPETPLLLEEEEVPPSAEDAQLLQFYAGQCRTHYATLLAATEALLASAGANQPPGVFVPHGRFVLVTAHKLVFVGDTLARQAASAPVRARVGAAAGALCQALKGAVLSVKGAALSYPSAPAARLLQERLAELSRRAQGFTSLLSTLAPS